MDKPSLAQLFKKNSVGIDIADHTIEVAEVSSGKEKPVVENTGRVLLEPGIVERGQIKNKELLAKAVREALAKAKPRPIEPSRVIVGLPESRVYTHVFELGTQGKQNLDALITQEAETSIPLPREDLIYSWKIIAEDKNRLEILLVGTSKKILQEWSGFFQSIGLKVEVFDIETLALFRGLFVSPPKNPVCVVDIGAVTTMVAIFTDKGLRYAYSFEEGGGAMTESIAKALKLDFEAAEKLKIDSGLMEKNGQLVSILSKHLQHIADEVKMSIEYFRERTQKEIKEVVLVGGTSKLKGIVGYLKTNLAVSVWVGEPVFLKNRTFLEYVEAIGLAVRGIDARWENLDPGFAPSQIIGEASAVPAVSPTIGEIPAPAAEKPQRSSFFEKSSFLRDVSYQPLAVLAQETEKLRFQKRFLISVLLAGTAGISIQYGMREYRESQRASTEEQRGRIRSLWDEYVRSGRTAVVELEQANQAAATSTAAVIPEAEKEEEPKKPLLIIKKTNTGWLNVRAGPGTGNALLGRVNPGESYPQLDKQGEWYKIPYEEGKEGWVSGQYVDIQ